MNKDEKMAVLQAYEARHGETIGVFIAWWGVEQYHHMVLVAEHFLYDKTISEAARIVGISPQGANKICAQFRYQSIIFCQTIKRDPEEIFIPLLRATNSELEKLVGSWQAMKIRGTVESEPMPAPPAPKPKKAR